MAEISGGVALARSLKALGVSEVFTLHGGHLDSFLVACQDNDIRLTDTRHEASAGHAAEAFARAAGEVGVCVITAGPGFANVLTSIVNAWLDATPVLYIAGAPPLREVETNPLQGGFDQVAMAAPVTKWAHRVTHVERIPDLVEKAVRLARSGRPGPVFLEVPIDVMFGRADEAGMRMPARPAFEGRPAPSAAAADRLLAMLREAERPVIIAGGGAASVRAAGLLRRFASLTGVPVLESLKGAGVLPPEHPQYVGGAGALAVAAMVHDQRPDLVVLLGARMGLFLGGRSGAIIPDGARVAQIDVDGAEIGRLRPVDLAIVADAAETLEALLARGGDAPWPDRGAWTKLLQEAPKLAAAPFAGAPPLGPNGLLHPFHAARAVAEALAPDTAIAWDGGEAPAWIRPLVRTPEVGLNAGNGYLGCLGVGQGFAIGLARARPRRPVALFLGDGAAGFHIAEFDTMVRHRLPVTTVIFNNACWGMSQHGQELVFGRQHLTAVKLAATDYHEVARGFGCYGEKVTRLEDIAPAIRRAQAQDLPACVNIVTDPDVVHPVTVTMVGDVESEGQIPVPYYENIPVPGYRKET
ncbi:thiamine pyrophosphate-binding protein [Camelimonas abortus]|uniref:Thiamine pyrophosphate-binding protein n=1 Tax=Camelimonas abortus TaxID=1017184 RepID=A0ABV7LFV0_9HYPH